MSKAEPAAPRLMISAAHKSSGKTLVTLGLAAAFAARGQVVQTFKKGPDYIDPMWLALASGRPCFNLDNHLSDEATLRARFKQSSVSQGINLVEGNMGLHDGMCLEGADSNAALARLLGLPVLLVLDACGMTRGVAPLLLGYQAFDPHTRIAGVILNNVSGARHESKLRAVIEHYTDVPVLGALGHDARLSLSERHLGLVSAAEVDGAAGWVQSVGQALQSLVDLDRVQALAGQAIPLSSPPAAPLSSPRAAAPASAWKGAERLRIAVARDRAFGFYYPDDLAALEAAGAELLFIDTLSDQRLPAVDGLFIGGGFPETSLGALEANAGLRSALRQAIAAGLPTYAECGGLMYLSRRIRWQGRSAEMVGAIAADTVMQARPVGRGYVKLQETAHHPWGADGSAGAVVRGHEFHHSTLENIDPSLRFAYRVQRGHGIDGAQDGVCVQRLLASYTHLRTEAGAHWAPRFVDFVRHVRAQAAAKSDGILASGLTPPRPEPSHIPRKATCSH